MSWLWLCALCLAASTPVLAVMGGQHAAAPELDAAVVFTQKNGLSARLEGIKDQRGYYIFSGLRYAEPPLDIRRFQRPARRYLIGDITAKTYCPPCPQMDPKGSGKVIGHEDCLCLNVFAPQMPGDENGCPVVFFIHGGNHRTGSATPYGGQHFTQKDTILVTAQYRLGSLGFLSTGEIEAPGNMGLFDLRAAVAWIQDYISFFGGDSSRITIMGHGSGGSAACIIALFPECLPAMGVIALSGAPLSPGAVRINPLKHAEALAEKTGCPIAPAVKLVICLRRLPTETIIMADNAINSGMVDVHAFIEAMSGLQGPGSRVEGPHDRRSLPPLVPQAPGDSLMRDLQHVPIITGVNLATTYRAVTGKYKKILTTQIKEVKDFIKKDIIGGLIDVLKGVKGLIPLKLLNQVLQLPHYYQVVVDNSLNVNDALGEIIEALDDALFNFPAYQTVRQWSSSAPAFLYSFEHVGNLTRGGHFLPGLAHTQGPADVPTIIKSKVNGPAYGDELSYLFEPLDEEGNPLREEISSTDARVRDSFIKLFVKFAQNSKRFQNGTDNFDFMPFSSENEHYLKISDFITTKKKFRYCQMGLWGGMAERVKESICKKVLGHTTEKK